jgi:hypothetical protein
MCYFKWVASYRYVADGCRNLLVMCDTYAPATMEGLYNLTQRLKPPGFNP